MTSRFKNIYHKDQSDNPIQPIRLAQAMEAMECSNKDLAELAEISVTHVSQVLKGNRGVSNNVLERLAWALDTTTIYLSGGRS